MPILQTSKDVFGERKGSTRPLHRIRIIALLLLAFILPQFAGASNAYLEDNADGFIIKTKNSYGQIIALASLVHDYDANMITAIIVIESEGNEVALSHKGARGLMQLMPATAKAMGAKDPNDPLQNVLAGTRYLKELENRYGFTPEEALVAYNMGPTRAKRWLARYDSTDYGYVHKVMYVHKVLEDHDREAKRVADALDQRIEAQSRNNTAELLLTSPKNLSLASLPFSLLTRREGLITQN